MKCEDINALLTAYMDQEVSHVERTQIEVHLSVCENCRKEMQILTSTRERLCQALRVKANRVEPSSQAWNNVRHRIESKSSFWETFNSMLAKPILRVAIPVAVVLIVLGSLWGTGVLPELQIGKDNTPIAITTAPAITIPPPTTAPPTTTTPPIRSLEVTAVTDKLSYLPGEQVEIKLSLINITQEPLTLNNFPPYTEISRLGFLVRKYDRGDQQVNLAPGESTTYTMIWDQLDNEGKAANPAVYQIATEYIDITKDSLLPMQESYHKVATVTIEFTQGAMEKIIEVNQSQTVDGVTLTLKRVELSATEIKVYFSMSPNYVQGISVMRSKYRIDEGEPLPVSWGYRMLEKGVEFVWGDLYPAPNDAQMLFFSITEMFIANVGNYGPFNFQIQLQ